MLSDRDLAERLGAAAHERYADWHSTAEGFARADARPRRPHAGAPRRAEPVRLVVLTQVVDADHPALAQTVDILDALARRCEEVVVLCDHVGRYELPANVRHPNVRLRVARSAAGIAFERAARRRAAAAGRRPDAVLAHMIPTFLTLAAPLVQAAPDPARALVHALERRPFAPVRDAAGGRRPQRRPPLVPAREPQGARDRPRDRRAAVPSPRPGPKPHDGPLRLLALGRMTAVEGLHDDAGGAPSSPYRAGLDATLEIRGPALTAAEEAHLDELAADRRRAATSSASASLWSRPSRATPIPALLAAGRRAPQRDPARGERDPRQGRLRGGRRRRPGAVEQRGARRVPRRPSGPAPLRTT